MWLIKRLGKGSKKNEYVVCKNHKELPDLCKKMRAQWGGIKVVKVHHSNKNNQ
jgi:hypothetical protein